jgi:1-acyl-sn-glycerol-3-phosphate acyltransferase
MTAGGKPTRLDRVRERVGASELDQSVRDAAELDLAWTRTAPFAALRSSMLRWVLGPLMDLYTSREIHGTRNIDTLDGPVVFVANHCSHLDTPAILRALPGRWRRRTAVVAATDYFYACRRDAILTSLAFGTVPIHRHGRGLGAAAHLDRLIRSRRSLLVFAEGTRSHDGNVARLRSGAAVLASQYEIPIVPIFVSGTSDAMPRGSRWMAHKHGARGSRRHAIEIRFGAPISARQGEHCSEMMERVRLFLAESGAATEPGRAPAAGSLERAHRGPV